MRGWVKTTPMWIPDDAIKAAREFVPSAIQSLIMQPGETVAQWRARVDAQKPSPGRGFDIGLIE